MKIPETSANIGAYYGNEETGQWQPNGVIIDSGVGGGVVGSGDAGVRPPYPIHIPRNHIPAGYVMAGAYYGAPYGAPPPAPPQDDFADYMWMENEEEFDKQVMQQLEEEALMEQCIEAMLEDEQRERQRPHNGHSPHYPTTSNGTPGLSLEETVSRSTLNPLAAEFVPSQRAPNAPAGKVTVAVLSAESASPQESPPAPAPTAVPTVEPSPVQETRTPPHTHIEAQPSDPPEVSAADLTPTEKPKDKPSAKTEKKPDMKKTPVKQEPAKKKPAVVKSDSKLQTKKKEVKTIKSEVKVEEKVEEQAPVDRPVAAPAPLAKVQPTPVEEPTSAVPKPINYAAAARANKPKKPPTPPTTVEKTPPPELKPSPPPDTKIQPKTDKKLKEKPVQRKNSAK